jgi:hypothetical protein
LKAKHEAEELKKKQDEEKKKEVPLVVQPEINPIPVIHKEEEKKAE